MKKTKVILFILLFVLVIGFSTQVKASIKSNGETIYFVGTYSEFLKLSEEERNSINDLCIAEDNEEDITISLKDMHLEDMKLLYRLTISNNYKIKDEEYGEIPNIKEINIHNFENIEELIKVMKNLEDIYINIWDSDIEFDYSILKNFKNLKYLAIDDKHLTDIEQLPEIETLRIITINFFKEIELKNIEKIGSKFKNLTQIDFPNTEFSYDDLMEGIQYCDYLRFFGAERMIVVKDCGIINKGDEVKLTMPYPMFNFVGYEDEDIKTDKCKFIAGSMLNYEGVDYVILDTDKVGEHVAVARFQESNSERYIEFQFKYTVEEKEETVVEEPKQEESKPGKEQTNTSTPAEPVTGTGEEEITGGFLSKIIDTIKNLINSIIEKITNLFKFKF